MSTPLVLRFEVRDDGSVTLGHIKQEVRAVGGELDQAKARVSLFEKAWGGMTGVLSSVKNAVFSLKGALAGLGAGMLARDFVSTAAETERLRLTMNLLTGSVEEGRKQFDLLRQYAMESPATFQEIMRAAVMMRGALKTDSGQTLELVRMADDIAARFRALGVTTEEAAGQIVRMWSAGAGAADEFQHKGVNAMLGFKMGVQYSVEETRRMLLEAYNDPANHLKGFATGLKTTWDGIVSMIADSWYDVKTRLADAGAFDAMKAQMDRFRAWLAGWVEANRDTIRAWGEKAGEYVSKAGDLLAKIPGCIDKIAFALKALMALAALKFIYDLTAGTTALSGALGIAGVAASANPIALAVTAIVAALGLFVATSEEAHMAFAVLTGDAEAYREAVENSGPFWAREANARTVRETNRMTGQTSKPAGMTAQMAADLQKGADLGKLKAITVDLARVQNTSAKQIHEQLASLAAGYDPAKPEAERLSYLEQMARRSTEQAGAAPDAVDWSSQLAAKDAAAAREKEAAAKAASLELAKARDIYQAIEDRNRGIEQVDQRRLELTREMEAAGQRLAPLSHADALERDYARQREILAAKKEEIGVELNLAQARGGQAADLEKVKELQRQIQSLDGEMANLPILEALDKEIEKRKEAAALAQAQSEAAIKNLETGKASMESGASMRIAALEPADKNQDSAGAMAERNRIALDALKQGFDYDRRILDLKIEEAQRAAEAATQDAERVKLAAELNALTAQRGILQDEEAQKTEQLKRDQAQQAREAELARHPLAKYAEDLQARFDQPLTTVEQKAVEVAQTMQSSMSTALQNIISGTGTWKDAMVGVFGEMRSAFIRVIADMAAEAMMLQALSLLGVKSSKSPSYSLTGGGLLGTLAGLLGGSSKSALGNVFDRGDLVPFALGGIPRFAYGGVVSRPTVFPMASGGVGLMGEAGPEAIMPLKRTGDGRLGVAATQTQPRQTPIELTIHNNIVQDAAAVLSAMAAPEGRNLIVNTVTSSNGSNGPIRRMIKGDG